HPARLKIFEVGAARNFQIRPAIAGSRRPNFEVVGFGRTKSQITGAKLDHAVMEPEHLQNFFRVRDQGLQFFVRLFRRRDLHQLHLVELMDAENSSCLTASGAGLTPKTRRVSRSEERRVGKRRRGWMWSY